KPGKHRLTVRVDNRMILPYRADAHSVSDSLGGSWNGIVGKMEMRSTPLVWIEDVRVFPRAGTQSILVKGVLGNATPNAVTNFVALNFIPRMAAGGGAGETLQVVCTSRWTAFETEVHSSYPVKAWDEFNPELFELTVTTSSPSPSEEASR